MGCSWAPVASASSGRAPASGDARRRRPRPLRRRRRRLSNRTLGLRPAPAAGRGAFDDLFGIEALETLLGGPRPPANLPTRPRRRHAASHRLHQAGPRGGVDIDEVGRSRPHRRLRRRRGDGGDAVTAAHLAAPRFASAATSRRPSATRCRPTPTSAPVAAPSGSGRHADTHDVIVLQVAGSKAWDVDGLGPLSLLAGDVLYLPAGTSPPGARRGPASVCISRSASSPSRAARCCDGSSTTWTPSSTSRSRSASPERRRPPRQRPDRHHRRRTARPRPSSTPERWRTARCAERCAAVARPTSGPAAARSSTRSALHDDVVLPSPTHGRCRREPRRRSPGGQLRRMPVADAIVGVCGDGCRAIAAVASSAP